PIRDPPGPLRPPPLSPPKPRPPDIAEAPPKAGRLPALLLREPLPASLPATRRQPDSVKPVSTLRELLLLPIDDAWRLLPPPPPPARPRAPPPPRPAAPPPPAPPPPPPPPRLRPPPRRARRPRLRLRHPSGHRPSGRLVPGGHRPRGGRPGSI